MKKKPILIVGAGPTGLTLALVLARANIPVRIIDQNKEPAEQSRALAITARTLEIFFDLGLIDEVLQKGLILSQLNFVIDQSQSASIPTNEIESRYPEVVSLPQSETERLLIERLKVAGISVEREKKLIACKESHDHIVAEIQSKSGEVEVVHAQWLGACDGAHSTVRELLKLPFIGKAYSENLALMDVKMDWKYGANESNIFLSGKGFMGAIPLPGGYYRLIMMRAESMTEMPTTEEFQAAFSKVCEGHIHLHDPIWISRFHLQRRMVKTFQKGRVFLLGDAAHVHSPAGGQGMNTGIQDAFNLGWKWAAVEQGLLPSSILETYFTERAPIAHKVLKTTDRLTRLVTLQNSLLCFLRKKAILWFVKQKKRRVALLKDLAQIGFVYQPNALVSDHFPDKKVGVPAGMRAFDSTLYPHDNAKGQSLYDVIGQGRFTLLLFSGERPASQHFFEMMELITCLQQDFPNLIRMVWIVRDKSLLSQCRFDVGDIYLDNTGEASFRYAAQNPCFYFIRPDQHIAYRAPMGEAIAFLEWLRGLLLKREI